MVETVAKRKIAMTEKEARIAVAHWLSTVFQAGEFSCEEGDVQFQADGAVIAEIE